MTYVSFIALMVGHPYPSFWCFDRFEYHLDKAAEVKRKCTSEKKRHPTNQSWWGVQECNLKQYAYRHEEFSEKGTRTEHDREY
ncbi:uncharacterized protein LOC142765477 isoform X3 [Rhipicephalus microplus]|uniref:uncharacterized protein LOC142765477 isoform X3 n=1 Tax=Rhipicephalus microplus TaxID=6941 RepID=UPI003F6A6020